MKTASILLFSLSTLLSLMVCWSLRERLTHRVSRWLRSFDSESDYPVNRVLFDLILAAGILSIVLASIGAGWLSLLACPICLGVPYVRRHFLRKRNEAALQAQLPDFCEFLAAAVRAGVSLRTALDELQTQVSAPLSRELGRIRNEQRLGASVAQSFDRWSQQGRGASLHEVAFCIRVSQESGGGLAESLINTARALRQTQLVQEKAKALSAQGRLQALVMMAIPPILLLTVSAIDPFTSDFFFQSVNGGILLGIVVLLEIVGFRWIQRIVRVE